jgi:DNA modification methylase
MAFKYNPPTRTFCKVCEELAETVRIPIIDTHNGKASSANNFPFHNWYNFVLGYSPEFPEYIISKYKIYPGAIVVDPFMGTGTTLVECKRHGIESHGVDANDYFVDVAKTKLKWDLNISQVKRERDVIIRSYNESLDGIDFDDEISPMQSKIKFSPEHQQKHYSKLADEFRTELLDERYICDRPLVKLAVLKNIIVENASKKNKDFFLMALSAIIVPVSNVRYGPGFGVSKPKKDVDVIRHFISKVDRMISDLASCDDTRSVKFHVHHGDARQLDKHFESNSIDFMITSPPYPGDHEYTKHTKLELIFMDYAATMEEFRVIKKRMLRGSTTNIYKEDNDRELVADIKSIQSITELIDERLKNDGATSGFEKLYTKLVWEYFGGMYKNFISAKKVLKKNGKYSLLVSDSHAFKMTHIKTAEILGEVALKAGFKNVEIELWQNKISTSHKYNLHENIITITK